MNEEELIQQPKLITRSAIIYASFAFLIPGIIGLIMFFFNGYDVIGWEVMYVVAGLASILFIFIRGWARDGHNIKKTGSIKEDRTSIEYKKHRNFNFALLIVGLFDLLFSLVFFIIRLSIGG